MLDVTDKYHGMSSLFLEAHQNETVTARVDGTVLILECGNERYENDYYRILPWPDNQPYRAVRRAEDLADSILAVLLHIPFVVRS